MSLSQITHWSFPSWHEYEYGGVCSSPSLPSHERYSNSLPHALRCKRNNFPHQSYFPPDCSKFLKEDYFSSQPYCGSLGLSLDEISTSSPQCDYQCSNAYNDQWDCYIVMQ